MFVKEISLPKVPSHISNIAIQQALDWVESAKGTGKMYRWISADSTVEEWCQKNICKNAQWAIQILTADLPNHVDDNSKVKIQYLLSTGGDQVVTKSYKNNVVVDIALCDSDKWYILKTDESHGVYGVTDCRIAIAARIF